MGGTGSAGEPAAGKPIWADRPEPALGPLVAEVAFVFDGMSDTPE
jgi:hypothetical protein